MDLLETIKSELGLSQEDALKVFYFIQERERKILQTVQSNLNTI
jgi:hypothetical protein